MAQVFPPVTKINKPAEPFNEIKSQHHQQLHCLIAALTNCFAITYYECKAIKVYGIALY